MERRKAESFEGMDIMMYLEKEVGNIDDDELTKGRIRSIFVKINYGQGSVSEVADYYGLPTSVVRDISLGRIFKSITRDLN